MKRAVILHGTDATPNDNWFPWLKRQLEADGYNVWAPLLPDNFAPNRQTYNNFLFNSNWDFTNNLVVGHSSGAVAILNMLMDDRCPPIAHGVMVGAWAHDMPTGMENVGQFANLFPPGGFDYKAIKLRADKLSFLHAEDDPYCPVQQAKDLAANLDAELTILSMGGHFGADHPELPELLKIIIK
jgi:uncharacterized protein